jgi:hypothetical protein
LLRKGEEGQASTGREVTLEIVAIKRSSAFFFNLLLSKRTGAKKEKEEKGVNELIVGK